jgi:hypothetical protein
MTDPVQLNAEGLGRFKDEHKMFRRLENESREGGEKSNMPLINDSVGVEVSSGRRWFAS